LTVSEEAKEHLNIIWSDVGDKGTYSLHKKCLNSNLDLKIDFENGKLLSYSNIDKIITEVHRWITNCSRLPKMSMFRELHYVASFIVPELCVFALSKERKCSLEEAKQIYDECRNDSRNGLSSGSTITSEGTTSNGVASSPLDNLALAAKMKLDEVVEK